MEKPKYIARLEQYLWEFYIEVDSACSCGLWERTCLECLEWLEEQYRLAILQQRRGIQSLFGRIARLESLRHSLRKRYKPIDVRVPALSTNTPVTSLVQMIQGREIGLKKSNTIDLDHRLRDHEEVMYKEWDFDI